MGLFHWDGQAIVGEQVRPWTLMLKITRSDADYYSNDPSSWKYWDREALAYQSGLLDDLPGQLAAPRCFGVYHFPNKEIWIWMEAIPIESTGTWPLSRYGVAARHLGQFNGAYLSGRSLPSHSWLSHGRIEEWLVHANGVIPRLDDYLGHSSGQNVVCRRYCRANDEDLVAPARTVGRHSQAAPYVVPP